ncbi:unnamed protein product [Bursaphelenchus okinawaensis]|uniref:Peptidase_M1 domain-containing protein n=1 Tax=Bursaphelenchus okinawaensis TaxID=465554 RepID=A0A811LM03_9BILA|nr:unnamed protein product [Bursaphelenchus okinawaensis]CAG9124917.1 unnamed protein product [Bursaphelenchus okinawaensis]
MKYDITLTLKSFSNKVHGMVQIQFQCTESTSEITLHAFPQFLVVEHALLENRLLDENEPLEFPFTNTTRQTLTFKLKDELIESHVYYLSIWYSTRFNTHRNGMIKNKDMISKTLWIHTLLEPRYARTIFPCFDEPKYRASFKLEIWLEGKWADESITALSATPSKTTSWNSNLTIWEFDPTPPIPPYIFSFSVGKFESYCEAATEVNDEVCLWRLHNRNDWNATAAVIVEQIRKYQRAMIEYLGVEPKARLHVMIVPTKLRGMENHGLLIVNENLYFDFKNKEKFNTFMKTLYHELAHQWFGNLVTMEFWDHVWLAEGFTTFLSRTRPIVFDSVWDMSILPIVDKSWALNLPDIAYTKASSILEMLSSIIGEDKLKLALQAYVKRYQYKAATTEDFLEIVLEITRALDALKFLKSWLYTSSMPLVFIDYDHHNQTFTLSQVGRMIKLVDNRWFVPVWTECLAGSKPETLHWITPAEPLVLSLEDVTGTNSTDAVAFNRNRSVYYQISYRY